MSSILSNNFENEIDRHVTVVNQKENKFKEMFSPEFSCPLMIDPLLEADMKGVANEVEAGYLDLSEATSFVALTNGIMLYPEAIIFDNIDQIPESEDKEYIEQTVLYALKKEEDTPLAKEQWLDFSKIKVGARCKNYPDYLKGKSLQTFIIEV